MGIFHFAYQKPADQDSIKEKKRKCTVTMLPEIPEFANSLASQAQAAVNIMRNKSPNLPSMMPETTIDCHYKVKNERKQSNIFQRCI